MGSAKDCRVRRCVNRSQGSTLTLLVLRTETHADLLCLAVACALDINREAGSVANLPDFRHSGAQTESTVQLLLELATFGDQLAYDICSQS